MISLIPRYIFNFFFFIFLQVLILNKIEFSGYINPYLYVLFILTLPFETPGWLLLVLASILGVSIDIFSNTPGMHMAAILLMAYLRRFVLMRISPREGYEVGTLPIPSFYGFPWFFKYAGILVVIHHLFYFFIESFSFSNIIEVFGKTIFSSVFTLILMAITLLFTYQKRNRI
ncbi:rod shape-determining protein MreD [Plebeiibacterium sediminum]|uniref:Rod shape-determining protein MreD n=1 Tax=Plebeiibacterium sediminum TaxID=2992112 RepID=A0AAE3SDM0_9BACT|nr:rod shape-determining protein MreD [Plebeiobacterium sediminum]MCW3784982.1 rod shape-determining protein MreD [Plebeiobacterium sediminum]